VKSGSLNIAMIMYYDTGKQKKVKKDFQFFLFNDLVVFMKTRKELAQKDLQKNKAAGENTGKNTIKVKQVCCSISCPPPMFL
jgi:hypothetical protein